MADVPSESLIGQALASMKAGPGALTQAEPVKREPKLTTKRKKRKKGKRPPPAESLYG